MTGCEDSSPRLLGHLTEDNAILKAVRAFRPLLETLPLGTKILLRQKALELDDDAITQQIGDLIVAIMCDKEYQEFLGKAIADKREESTAPPESEDCIPLNKTPPAPPEACPKFR